MEGRPCGSVTNIFKSNGASGSASVDPAFFLSERLKTIQVLHDVGSAAFLRQLHLIKNREAPFDDLPEGYDPEFGEPPFIEEYIRAGEALELLARSTLSIASDALKTYFAVCEQEFGLARHDRSAEVKKAFKERGFLRGYEAWYEEALGIKFNKSNVNLDLIEEAILLRNEHGHYKSITSTTVAHPHGSTAVDRSVFLREGERDALRKGEGGLATILGPTICVADNPDQVSEVFAELQKLANWLDREIISSHRHL